MDNLNNDGNGGEPVAGKKGGILASKRFILIVVITLILLWLVWTILGFLEDRSARKAAKPTVVATEETTAAPKVKTPGHLPPNNGKTVARDTRVAPSKSTTSTETQPPKVAVPTHAPVLDVGKGTAFVTACMEPLAYELNERFWGWRPNDILNVTDNVNNLQLGILEVTRRTSVVLAEHLSRTGSTDAYVPSLESAMNCFMINSRQYWFPTAESKYNEGLDEMKNYIRMLKNGEARFYRRVDNLVPLFRAFESMLGSCDENLVKNQGDLSTFKADDYFYYSKGVAHAMETILEATAEDFSDLIASIQGTDVLHHAITALGHAANMDPWIVFEGSPDGFIANHRSNMAAHISHARFYLGVLNSALTGNIQ
ncbi:MULTISPECIES: DUF2333 family protein [Desulfococcus]|jgi:hypothetical protein|uniref:Putative conserved protein UCP029693 n=1 Tax=Desulfococcus multivorans DSM 2059 TaxID=1121405 RepID=S7TRC7_DESML|nr:DUF2333 family protein [Desulfococcus multivorans]AOY60601.1 uncharacterized protein, DUF2333 [Desulfococcus multivorans]AQV02695.1 hypothetical protein B2D07_19195 [Desulfococcus multivorans]EPR39692.1 putative conserved protein UCP029693 [Desulfococcus multivorans DSM 2059]MDX9818655.1 DUF2333 family protein [Desulfococcus multivorans]SKA04183.1 hypothetical protein SAMN02745446_02525 [Desulfococcus multivorans DSM 2059]